MEKPSISIKKNVPTNETGTAIAGIKVERKSCKNIYTSHQQRFDNCPAQMRGRFCPGDGFDSNRTVIEVDVAAGLILSLIHI